VNSDGRNGAGALDALEMLAAWREQGADRVNPIRFHFIEGLARRAVAQGGLARGVLDDKLAKLLASYAQELEAAANASAPKPADAIPQGAAEDGISIDAVPEAASSASSLGGHTSATWSQRGPLADLLDSLAEWARTRSGSAPDTAGQPGHAGESEHTIQPVYPELPLLDYFRDTWSRYSTKRQLKQSQDRVPENAGPLNSSLLVHRTLSLMREVSPEYLHQFLSYVDALSWIGQATSVDILLDKEGQRAAPAKKATRGGSR
jgi:hypothetical protein